MIIPNDFRFEFGMDYHCYDTLQANGPTLLDVL